MDGSLSKRTTIATVHLVKNERICLPIVGYYVHPPAPHPPAPALHRTERKQGMNHYSTHRRGTAMRRVYDVTSSDLSHRFDSVIGSSEWWKTPNQIGSGFAEDALSPSVYFIIDSLTFMVFAQREAFNLIEPWMYIRNGTRGGVGVRGGEGWEVNSLWVRSVAEFEQLWKELSAFGGGGGASILCRT